MNQWFYITPEPFTSYPFLKVFFQVLCPIPVFLEIMDPLKVYPLIQAATQS